MSLIKTLMGRRQFLIATGVASTCALTCKKLAGFQTRAAMAAEQAASAGIKAAGNRCPHLLSPLRIRNVVLKNRIMHTVSPNYLMQGPENFPTEAWRNHYSNMAKNAAIVSISTSFGTYPKTYPSKSDAVNYDWAQISNDKWEDIPPVYNYVEKMIEDIHCEGALVLFTGNTGNTGGGGGGGGVPGGAGGGQGGMPGGTGGAQGSMPGGTSGGPGGMPGGTAGGQGGMPGGMPDGQQAGAQGGMPGGSAGGQGGMPTGMPGGPASGQANKSVEEIVKEAKEAVDKGYDVFQMNTSSLEAVQAVRSATNLIIMAALRIGGGMGGGGGKNAPGLTNVNQPSASEIEQAVEAARKLEGLADFVWIRDGRHEHPNSFIQDKEKPFNLAYAEAIKKAGLKILTCPSAGFHDPIQNDGFIAKGLTDMVGMTTPFFADPDLIRKVSAGRADDVIPCIQCHNCHGISMTKGPHYATCTVNPKWVQSYKLAGIQAPLTKKKVAVIGGGPGGMKAALVAAERGHKVTIYEKDAALGGLLKISEFSQWRWNHKDLKDFLINQVKKAGIEVKLNTTATFEMIKAANYDTVLVATGAEPVVSKMQGADAGNVFNILTCYSNKKALGKNVVMIGAGKFGTEAAIGMAKDGHKVTVLASGKDMVEPENIGAHNMANQVAIYQNHPNFSYVLQATVKGIIGGRVTYTDSKGAENSIQADSIVIFSGLKAKMDEAMKFDGSADEVLLLGDCTGKNGTIQKTIRSAFFVASQV